MKIVNQKDPQPHHYNLCQWCWRDVEEPAHMHPECERAASDMLAPQPKSHFELKQEDKKSI